MIDRGFLLSITSILFSQKMKEKKDERIVQQLINYSNHILYHFKY